MLWFISYTCHFTPPCLRNTACLNGMEMMFLLLIEEKIKLLETGDRHWLCFVFSLQGLFLRHTIVVYVWYDIICCYNTFICAEIRSEMIIQTFCCCITFHKILFTGYIKFPKFGSVYLCRLWIILHQILVHKLHQNQA